MRRPTRRFVVWLPVAAGALAVWVILLQKAADEAGPSGYFFQLAQTPQYLLAWIALFFALQVLITSAELPTRVSRVTLRLGVLLGLGPEVLLTLPILLGLEVWAPWYSTLDRAVRYLQLPGRTMTSPFTSFIRYAVGLTDPGAAWVAREIAILNLMNVCGWLLICVPAEFSIRLLRNGVARLFARSRTASPNKKAAADQNSAAR